MVAHLGNLLREHGITSGNEKDSLLGGRIAELKR